MDVITYPCWDKRLSMLVKAATGRNVVIESWGLKTHKGTKGYGNQYFIRGMQPSRLYQNKYLYVVYRIAMIKCNLVPGSI